MNAGESPNTESRSLRIGELIEHLGPRTVSVLGTADVNAPVLGTEFYDSIDELPDQAGMLLIIPSGARLDSAELSALAAEAAELRYAALVLKCFDEHVPTFTAIAETSGVPILRVVERVGWRLFEALVGGLLGEQRRSEDAHGDRGAEPLFALANELAGQFGGSVAIEDLGRRIVAYSSVPDQLIDSLRTRGILARRVPESPFNEDQYRTVIRTGEPIKYPQLDDELPRVACAVRAGALPLGTIWAIDASGEDPLTATQIEQMQRAAGIAAAHMLDDIRVREAGQAPREERLRTLLSGIGIVGSELAELGIPEERGALLLAFDPGSDDHPTTLAQLRTTVQRHLALYRPETATVVRRGRVYSLISHEQPAELARLIDPLIPVLDRLLGTGEGAGVVVAAPGSTHRVGGVAELRERADWLFEVAARATWVAKDRLLTVDALRPELLLTRVGELMNREAVLLDPRIEEMRVTQPRVAEAVLRWCESFGNVTRAAVDAGVHENTIRYRLRRAEERYGLVLGDPTSLLATWLQLRAASLAEGDV
ncbi:MAG: PucR family transcriptional regulator [Leucobacter sp.]